MCDESALAKVQFEILDRKEVLAISKVHVTNQMNNVEFKKNNSVHDTRFGTFKNVACGSCKLNQKDCPGHVGHITLVYPVLNPLFVSTNLKSITNAFCFNCNDVLKACKCVDTADVPATPSSKKRRLQKRNPSIVKINMHEKYTSFNGGVKVGIYRDGVAISIRDLYALLAGIPRDVYLKWNPGFGKFTDLTDSCFIHHLVVLPTQSRPPNFSDGVWRSDHLSRLYVEVLKANINLRMKHLVVHPALVDEYHNHLQQSINVLFDVKNTSKRMPAHVVQNGGIRQRIDGKGGRIRMNLMGKRVEFSARSVLSGDPHLSMNEIGIPPSVARNLTVPVKVNRYNLGVIHKYNIRYLIKASGERFDMNRPSSFSPRIEIGDTVERSLINGDTVVVNRQPTLHRGSILGMRVKIMNTSTFRLNYSSMVTLNGDTDGDEVNIHVPQDLASRAEIEELMMSSTNIVCSQNSAPLVGLIQDSLLGCYQLSTEKAVHRHDMMDILYKMDIGDVDLTQQHYRGVQVMDFVFDHLHIDIDHLEIPKAGLVIRDSKVLSGVFNKAVLGASDNSVIHTIFLSYGHIKAERFIHLMQKAATAWLDIDGFSVGIADCVVENHEPVHHGDLDAHIQREFDERGKLPDEEQLLDATGMVTKMEAPPNQTPSNNALLAMIVSGSKGSMMNYNQITRMVGQQVVGSGRVAPEMNHYRRTLPHYKPNELTLESRGFCKNNFVRGLSPQEFFFHAQAGRIGIIDTACKTATTGYTFRKLVKVLERCVVENGPDDTRVVKNMATGAVIQFDYGEDDMDGTYMKRLT